MNLAIDPIAAAGVAAAHHEAPRIGGALARAAFAQLIRETDWLFQLITQAHRPMQIFFTMSASPYGGVNELITSIRRDHVLEVTATARERDRFHPVMGCEVGELA